MNIIRVGGGSSVGGNTILVATDNEATVYATSNGKTITGVSINGVATLKVPKAGTWTVWAEKNGETASEIQVVVSDEYSLELKLGIPLSTVVEGSLIRINENGSGVNFFLAGHNYESGLNGTGRELLFRQNCYDVRAWNTAGNNAYVNSSIDTWLNGSYKSLLDSAVQSMITPVTFYYTVGNGTTSVSTLSRGVFLLSHTELGCGASNCNVLGTKLTTAETIRVPGNGGSNVGYWTRTAYHYNSSYKTTSHYVMGANYTTCTDATVGNTSSSQFTLYSRPAFTLPSNAMVNAIPNADGSYTLIV